MKIPLFDIDWTLIEGGNKAKSDAYDFAFKNVYGLPDATVKEIITEGMIDSQILAEVLKLHDVPVDEIQQKLPQAIKVMEEYFFQHENEGRYIVLPGVKELLSELKKLSIPAGVLTGNLEKIGWRKLENAGLKNYFCFGAFSNNVSRRVDLIPLAVNNAKKKCGVNADLKDFIIIGDSPLDIACAKTGGIQVIASAAGIFPMEELQKAGADLVLKSLEEKEKFIKFISQ